jgi:hypothetical protein
MVLTTRQRNTNSISLVHMRRMVASQRKRHDAILVTQCIDNFQSDLVAGNRSSSRTNDRGTQK